MEWSRWGKRCGRSVYQGRPRGRGGRSGRGAGRGASVGVRAARAWPTLRGLQRLLAELAQRVVAALEQLARHRQAGADGAEPLRRLGVVVTVGAADWAASNSAQRSA